MRGRLWEKPLRGEPIALGQVMIGEGVGEVVFSSDPRLREGEIVRGEFGWQKYAVTTLEDLEIIDRQAAPLSTALGILGMPGLTAYYGMLEVAAAARGRHRGGHRRRGSRGQRRRPDRQAPGLPRGGHLRQRRQVHVSGE